MHTQGGQVGVELRGLADMKIDKSSTPTSTTSESMGYWYFASFELGSNSWNAHTPATIIPIP